MVVATMVIHLMNDLLEPMWAGETLQYKPNDSVNSGDRQQGSSRLGF